MFCVQEQHLTHVFLYFGVGGTQCSKRLCVSCDTCLGAEFDIWAALSPDPGEADTARAATNVAVSEGRDGFGHFIVLCVQKQQFIHCVFLYFGVGVHSGASICGSAVTPVWLLSVTFGRHFRLAQEKLTLRGLQRM